MLALPLGSWAVLSRPSLKNCHDVGGEPGLAFGEGLVLTFSCSVTVTKGNTLPSLREALIFLSLKMKLIINTHCPFLSVFLMIDEIIYVKTFCKL